MKNTNTTEQTGQRENAVYCADCGMELDNAALSEMIKDYKLLVRKFASCKKEGKFTGDLCSKIFNAVNGEEENPPEENLEFF
ncbi:MAG: hypothetical protein A2068_14340 [Ignavibacteria bacterium GWB2_35_6b]|nr:MAG: hypothetical protein A2068_14340 [Ignavibacteria bacterium GWB2_35_6b]